jgi:hypothetical protein
MSEIVNGNFASAKINDQFSQFGLELAAERSKATDGTASAAGAINFLSLWRSIRDNLNDIVLLLLDDTDIDKYWHKFNCLFILCRFYQKENLLGFVQIFLDRKIDINCKDDEGWTPLLILCRYYDKDNLIDIIRLFLNEKFDLEINWRNNDRFNALHILCGHYTKDNLIDIIKLFLQRKIDINCKTNIGWNALLQGIQRHRGTHKGTQNAGPLHFVCPEK